MNNTNRGLNRTITTIVGVLALIAGAGLLAVALVPVVRGAYRATAPQIAGETATWVKGLRIPGTTASWGWILVLAVLVLIIVLLLVFILRQGHGHYGRLIIEEGTDGTTIIESAVAEQALRQDLDARHEFVSSHVSTYRVRGAAVLKVSVTCRRGVSPRDATDIVEDALRTLDALLGREVPALLQISGGFRARASSATRTA